MNILASTTASAVINQVAGAAISTFTSVVPIWAFAIGIPLAFAFFFFMKDWWKRHHEHMKGDYNPPDGSLIHYHNR